MTEVDTLCEKGIVQMILEAFPDHDLLTEERPFERKGSQSWKWIIDPLDGTTNYFHGFPCFCVSIGLEVGGEVRLGVVYDPLLDELFHAEKGKGAFLNGKRIHVSRVDHLDRSFLSTGFPTMSETISIFIFVIFESLSLRVSSFAGQALLLSI